jgi:hypothetical protein
MAGRTRPRRRAHPDAPGRTRHPPTGPPDLLHLPFRQPLRRRNARRTSRRRPQRGRRDGGLAGRRAPSRHLTNGAACAAPGSSRTPGPSGRLATSPGGTPTNRTPGASSAPRLPVTGPRRTARTAPNPNFSDPSASHQALPPSGRRYVLAGRRRRALTPVLQPEVAEDLLDVGPAPRPGGLPAPPTHHRSTHTPWGIMEQSRTHQPGLMRPRRTR